jgi:hypothetical protein
MGLPHQEAHAVALPREKNGAVYTRPWVVAMMLDLTGFTPDKPMHLLHAEDEDC